MISPLNPYTAAILPSLPIILHKQGGKNRRRGKNEEGEDKRELIFKEDGQGECSLLSAVLFVRRPYLIKGEVCFPILLAEQSHSRPLYRPIFHDERLTQY